MKERVHEVPTARRAASGAVAPDRPALAKAPTGIVGLDEITGGGLPLGRTTLVCGGAGCGKTLLGIEFIARGALEHGEPGVIVTFEESALELAENVRSLGFDLDDLVRRGLLMVDQVVVERSQIEETGEYDLEGLFIRLGYAIDSLGAKRVMLDTIEALFGGLSNAAVLRSELRRLFTWLKEKGVTAVVTGERGEGKLTRQGLEEYVSDCVILLDHRVTDQLSTRRLRVVKYRGTTHGTNEYPFLIDEDGISVLPITSAGLAHQVSDERISTGVSRLDAMLGGEGVHRGSSVLISGVAGTGKTTFAAHFAAASCRRGERCLYFAMEESEAQCVRNQRSVGLDLAPWIQEGLLRFHATRPTANGLEMHLVAMHKLVRTFQPRTVVIDPISALLWSGAAGDTSSMLMRMVDFLKEEHVTAVMTSLSSDDQDASAVGISSLIDTWIALRQIEAQGERNRGLCIHKARGTAHSNQVREFLLTGRGIEVRDVYVGAGGVLTGSLRVAQEEKERVEADARLKEIEGIENTLEQKRLLLDAQIAAQRAQFEVEREALLRRIDERRGAARVAERSRERMGRSRGVDVDEEGAVS